MRSSEPLWAAIFCRQIHTCLALHSRELASLGDCEYSSWDMPESNPRGVPFWKRLFQRRAQATGQLPDESVRERIGWQPSDAKVDNANPSEAFAVNVNVDLAHLFTLDTREEVTAYVVGRDDHGRPVATMPISKTSSTIWFDFASAGPELPYEGQDVPLAQFVSNLCHALKDDMLPRREEFDYIHIERAEDLVLRRISWLDSLNSWYPVFHDKPDTNAA